MSDTTTTTRRQNRSRKDTATAGGRIPKGPTFVWSSGKKAKALTMAQALRALAMVLRVGESEARALEVVGYEFRKYNVGRAFTNAATAMRTHGASFKEALLAQDVFPRTARELIGAAETSQAMRGSLERAAKLISQAQNVKKKMLTALIQPGFMLGLSLVFLFAATAWIIPGFVGTFATLQTETPPTIPIVLTAAEITKYVMAVLIGTIVLALLFWVFIGKRLPSVVQFVDAVTIRIPVIGPIVQMSAASRLFELLTASLVTGRSETASLESAAAGCGNEAMHVHAMKHAERMRTGDARLGEFARSSLFPPSAQYMLAAAPSVKQQIDVMNELAPEYRQEADNRLETFSKTIEPIMNYIVYGVAGALIVAIVVPMYSVFPALMHLGDTTSGGGSDLPPMG
jgi:type IV pilus assembly protein PilC